MMPGIEATACACELLYVSVYGNFICPGWAGPVFGLDPAALLMIMT